MAEAFLKQHGGDRYEVHSAGLEPGKLNPLVVEVMKESAIDISGNSTNSVDEYLDQGFDFVITVCDEASAERCPYFPGKAKRLHWSFQDPSSIEGSKEEKMEKIKEVRNQIERKVIHFVASNLTSQERL